MSASNLDLSLASLKLQINNFIGADIDMQINDLTTQNTNTGQSATISVDQNGNNIINNIYSINRAILTNNQLPIQESNKEIIINADEILEILPNNLQTHATFYLNPNSIQNTDNFLYPEFPIEASLNLEIPLELIAENLTLLDTNEINVTEQEDVEIESLYITLENGFPLDGNIQLIILDEQDLVIDTILNNSSILAANMNQNNEVTQANKSTITIDNIDLTAAKKIISRCTFSTNPTNEFVKIYSDYKMKATISAKFKQTIGK